MKALVKKLAQPGIWLEEVPEPQMGINDVLIRIDRTGICGTDLHIYNWDAWAQKTIPVPMVVGHEFVGRVVAVGSNVSDFKPGDIVSGEVAIGSTPAYITPDAIVTGERHLASERATNSTPARAQLSSHTKCVGLSRRAAIAELLTLPMTRLWHHAPGIDPDVASI